MAKIIVAMSGGVDSSVAALLLKKSGHELKGVFMKNYESPNAGKNCPWQEDQAEVKKVCKRLKIPMESWNFEKQYSKKVLNNFFSEYQAGRTPNPDVMCNKEIKFGLFLKKALALGYDAIATGHYVRLIKNRQGRHLLAGKDKNKDQSYFLYYLNQDQLARIFFPIGKLTKSEVRQIAKKARLPNAQKPDSQGICFVGKVDLKSFLKKRVKTKPGKIATTDGKIIGQHKGLAFYTIGQRHGINIGGGKPFYVAAKEKKKNLLVVTNNRKDPSLLKKRVLAANLNFITGKPLAVMLNCQARIRYRQALTACRLKLLKGKRAEVIFSKPVWAPALGQSIVFYQKQECLGGGIIKKVW